MRGKDGTLAIEKARNRITPAHAGKSSVKTTTQARDLGSPPHMRGKVDFTRIGTQKSRITPAHAGKS